MQLLFALKGVGGPRPGDGVSDMVFLIEENPSYQMLFTLSKNIVPSQSYRVFKS